MISEGKYIYLYGGEDIQWIRQFTTTVLEVADATKDAYGDAICGEGQPEPRETVRQINMTIEQENLSHTLRDMSVVGFFWVGLQSIWNSKVQTGKTKEDDKIMQEIKKMLSYNGDGNDGWAVISKGSEMTANERGNAILCTLMNYGNWERNVALMGFDAAFKAQLNKNQDIAIILHCFRLILPWMGGRVPDYVVCGECSRIMEKFIMYRCCTD